MLSFEFYTLFKCMSIDIFYNGFPVDTQYIIIIIMVFDVRINMVRICQKQTDVLNIRWLVSERFYDLKSK